MPQTGLIILAAGGSKRLGTPKQLLQFKGRSLLRHAAETALASVCRPVVVVLGAGAEALEPELHGLDVIVALNGEWNSGIGASIRIGLQHLMSNYSKKTVDSVVFMVCDQPLIRRVDIDRLCASHAKTGRGIVSSLYGDSMGVPALFSSKYFPELAALHASQGAKMVIAEHLEDNHSVPLPVAAFDVDTYQDYHEIVRKVQGGAGRRLN